MNTNYAPIKIYDIDLQDQFVKISLLDGYQVLRILVRQHGIPLGILQLPVIGGQVSAEAIEQAIQRDLAWPLQRQRLAAWLAVDENPPVWPSLTAAVCTRNRPDDVARCVTALLALDYPGKLEILVIDNAPSDDRTMDLVRAAFPQVRYVRESRPGLDWARNRAILEAHGEILAYTDDDVVVDRFWARELARTFALNPGVMAITGLVEPLELETPAQQAFEQYGGFGRGMIQRWYGINRAAGERAAAEHTATGKYGTGANMAYRRSLFERIGGFDPALDVGTISNGGGDLEMFYRVIKAGFPLVYEPRAIVWHRHRTDEAHFLTQITNNGVGFYAYLERCAAHFPDERLPIVRQGIWWFWYWYIYRYLLSFVRPVNTTRPVIRAELRGGIMGLGRYRKARRTAQRLARPGDLHDTLLAPAQTRSDLKPHAVAVRMIDLAERLGPISDVEAYPTTRVLVQFHGRLLGTLVIANLYQPISAIRLRDALLDQLGARLSPLLASPRWGEESRLLASSQREEESRLPPPAGAGWGGGDKSIAPSKDVSLLILSDGNPDDLARCLAPLHDHPRIAEIFVLPYTPRLPTIPPTPTLRMISPPRSNRAAALNAGIAQVQGAFVATLNAQMCPMPNWLDLLLAACDDPQVVAVFGSHQTLTLETSAQVLVDRVEAARPQPPRRMTPGWLREAPGNPVAWAIRGADHALFRTRLFADSQVGRFGEHYDPPTFYGVSEAYLCYRLLRAGYTLAHVPEAYVWRSPPPNPVMAQARIEADTTARTALDLLLLLIERDPAARWRLITAPRSYLRTCTAWLTATLRGRSQPAARLIRLRGALRSVVWLAQAHLLQRREPH